MMRNSWRISLHVCLGFAVLGGSAMAQAVTLGSVQVQSAMDEPLKAKIPLKNLNVPLSQIKASMASAGTYRRVGATSKGMPALSFNIQDAGNGKAYLWVTSKKPVQSPYLDLIIDVSAGSEKITHQAPVLLDPPVTQTMSLSTPRANVPKPRASKPKQQVAAIPSIPEPPDLPPINVDDLKVEPLPAPKLKEPKLKEPELQQPFEGGAFDSQPKFASATPLPAEPEPKTSAPAQTVQDVPLVPLNSAPPPMSGSPNIQLPEVKPPTYDLPDDGKRPSRTPMYTQKSKPSDTYGTEYYDATVVARQEIEKLKAKSKSKPKSQPQPQSKFKPKAAAKQAAAKPKRAKKSSPSKRTYYRVVRNDTLWSIARRHARHTDVSVYEVMNTIQALNQKAFIRGNPNLIRTGVTIAIPRYSEANVVAREKTKRRSSTSASGAARKAKYGSVNAGRKSRKNSGHSTAKKAPQPKRSAKAQRSATKPKPKLSIVAQNASGSAQGETNKDKAIDTNTKLSPQIVSQVRNARKATVVKRKVINKLNTELAGFTKRIKLQDDKLAQLEKRLKKLQASKKS